MVHEESLAKAVKSHCADEKNVACDLLCTADREKRENGAKGDVGSLATRQRSLGHRSAR
jgi:hypothetical protein